MIICDHDILCIKSEINELKRVEKFLFRIFEKSKLPQKYFNKVFLCISEAVVNSIEHGNKNVQGKEVFIQIHCSNEIIDIEIRDQGEGFNYQGLNDPTCRENIKKETGRGIYIMKCISSELYYDNRGERLKIKISLK